ncbi:hypothetical protein J120_00790 [candidate division TM6 bacterium JCVI TM6SC1]|uniref:Methyltransferase FkbM domain-containing protein n=1 Tax=candidate division TM6 bacterium JCVI TM6SC1 TaxID=1306947 RepID=A0A0D2K5H5_9BACT|nr:hypothetical protein J120_00790 [candidate division TM6 bacterium JCVI TM6SC1]
MKDLSILKTYYILFITNKIMLPILKNKHILLPILSEYLSDITTIVEAGAFNGTDTIKLAHTWPQAQIHAFEPIPQIYEKLVENTKHLHTVHTYNYALAESTGNSTFYVSENPKRPGMPFQAGSILKPTGRLDWSPITYSHTTTVPTLTIKDWSQSSGIDSIDIMWLDVQGAAYQVLEGAGALLRTIKALWIEVEFIQAYQDQTQYIELQNWLARQGKVAILSDASINRTDWFYANVLFVDLQFKSFLDQAFAPHIIDR